jgi:hypothetical protein
MDFLKWDSGRQAYVWVIGMHGTTKPDYWIDETGAILIIDAETGVVHEMHPCR